MGAIENGWGLDVILWFQSWRTPLSETFFLIFHYLGLEEFFLAALPLIYWCVNEAWGRRLTIFFMINAWLNALVKEAWGRPRPYQVSGQVNNVVEETSWGIPSGHAQNATVLFGAIALRVRQSWLTWLVVLYVLLMAISRMALGVHFPQDAIGGVLIGVLLLAIFVWAEPRLSVRLAAMSLWAQIGLTLLVAAIMLLIHPFLIPPTSQAGIEPGGTVIGTFVGMGIGFALEVRTSRFDARGAIWKRIVRYAIGLVGILALRFGLGAAFEGLEPDLVFRLIRYALIGFWAAFGAPWLFVKTGLARSHAETETYAA